MTWLSNETVDRLRDVATRPPLSGDRYVIVRPLGRGGMGAVYAARDAALGRDVALKVSNAVSAASGLETRLKREAQVLARLEHPGIVPVHDAGVLEDGRVFYVMKLVQGQTLEQHAPSLTSEAARLGGFERIVETVAFAHAAGVVHRDLKPSNVMVGRFGEVLVLDWGVAKIVGESTALGPADRGVASASDTGDGTRLGTAGFMAPEQARGAAAEAGPPADIFALGAVLSWLLSGASIPRRLRAIAAKCQAVDPEARYPNAAALLDDLARYRQGDAVSAHRETWLELAGVWFVRYRTFILLVVAYLVMRALLAVFGRM
jgi:serine/threonine protein kinase